MSDENANIVPEHFVYYDTLVPPPDERDWQQKHA